MLITEQLETLQQNQKITDIANIPLCINSKPMQLAHSLPTKSAKISTSVITVSKTFHIRLMDIKLGNN